VRNNFDLVNLLSSNDSIDLNTIDKFNRNCFDIAKQNNSISLLNSLVEIEQKRLLKNKQQNESIKEIKNSLISSMFYEVASTSQTNLNENNENSLINNFLASETISQMEVDLKNLNCEQILRVETMQSNSNRPSKFIKKNYNRKNYDFLMLDDSESTSDDEEFEKIKKKKISCSPVKNIEDTLIWLKNQANSTETISDEQEFSLTGYFLNMKS
jgi:hypothetical protein